MKMDLKLRTKRTGRYAAKGRHVASPTTKMMGGVSQTTPTKCRVKAKINSQGQITELYYFCGLEVPKTAVPLVST